jgi:transcriptional regulator GlxA family with amidase domain
MVHGLIIDLLAHIPEDSWEARFLDPRIVRVIDFIELHADKYRANEDLAQTARMATNAFIRLFRQNTGISPQHFIMNKRLDKAGILLHHGEKSIEQIAEECGFCDRAHFAKLFKKYRGTGPAEYRNLRA